MNSNLNTQLLIELEDLLNSQFEKNSVYKKLNRKQCEELETIDVCLDVIVGLMMPSDDWSYVSRENLSILFQYFFDRKKTLITDACSS